MSLTAPVGNTPSGQITCQIDDFPDYMGPVYPKGLPIESGGYRSPAFRHPFKKGSNFLFIDGRVQTMGAAG